MNGDLERIQISGLHGHKNLDVKLSDNTLILVGENGSGKTTFLRILFYFLSGRWLSLIQFPFERIVCTIANEDYEVTHEELVKAFRKSDLRFLLAEIPPPHRRRIIEFVEQGHLDRIYTELEKVSARYGIRSDVIIRQLEFYEPKPTGSKKALQAVIQKTQASISAQILYLPTYRRIERELNSIFEGVDSDDLRRQRFHFRQGDSDEACIELVEFGMRDVQQAIDGTLAKLREFQRTGLNTLSLKYLGDVVNQEYQSVGMKEIAVASEDTVGAVLDRIDESLLTKDHKDHLFRIINSARSSDAPTEHQKIICHYFLKLLHFQESLQQNEQHICAFCDLCSEYIVDKRFVYNSSNFTFSIVPKRSEQLKADIMLSDLSSGEKQIVSLFSHLYFSRQQRFFVLIDEPELSLSVPWQRRFLTDIHKGDFCAGIVAATHSPFIYDNELRSYAHSIGEFLKVRSVKA